MSVRALKKAGAPVRALEKNQSLREGVSNASRCVIGLEKVEVKFGCRYSIRSVSRLLLK